MSVHKYPTIIALIDFQTYFQTGQLMQASYILKSYSDWSETELSSYQCKLLMSSSDWPGTE
jgi:hypothetical protein